MSMYISSRERKRGSFYSLLSAKVWICIPRKCSAPSPRSSRDCSHAWVAHRPARRRCSPRCTRSRGTPWRACVRRRSSLVCRRTSPRLGHLPSCNTRGHRRGYRVRRDRYLHLRPRDRWRRCRHHAHRRRRRCPSSCLDHPLHRCPSNYHRPPPN